VLAVRYSEQLLIYIFTEISHLIKFNFYNINCKMEATITNQITIVTNSPVALIVLGMAGSGKTTFV
jgi:ABC-type Mn2+/Zn2+ transport system ATPase subunit